MALSNNPRREAKDVAADLAAQERGPARAPAMPRTSPGYVRATNPDGEPVTFVPGETLPEWALAALAGGRGVYDEDSGTWTIAATAPAPAVDAEPAATAAGVADASPAATAEAAAAGDATDTADAPPVGEERPTGRGGRRS